MSYPIRWIVVCLFLASLWPPEEAFAFRAMGARNTVRAIRTNTRQIFKPSFEIRSRYVGNVNAVGFSPDGGSFATGSANGAVQIWSMVTGQQELTLPDHAGGVLAVAFVPVQGRNAGRKSRSTRVSVGDQGGSVISSDARGGVRLWNLADGKSVRTFRGHQGPVHALVVTADGSRLITAGQDGSVRVWDVANGRQLKSLDDHAGAVHALALSPNGQQVASGGEDRTLRIWTLADGRLQQKFPAQSSPILALDWSPDGSWIATGHQQGNGLLWPAVGNGRPVSLTGHSGAIRGVSFRGDSRALATVGDDKTVRTWSLPGGQPLKVVSDHQEGVLAVAFSPDKGNSSLLLTGSTDRTARLWKSEEGSEIARMVSMRTGWAVVTPDGRFDGTLDGDLEDRLDAIKWSGEGHAFSLDGFVERHYRPALLGKIFSQQQGAHKDPDAVDVAEGFQLPPEVKVAVPSGASAQQVEVNVQAEDMGGGIDELRLYHNGKIVDQGKRIKQDDGGNGKIEKAVYKVALVDGDNVFKIVGLSNDRIESEPSSASLTYRASAGYPDPELHVFVVGINQYANRSLNLDFAVPDAKGVHDFFLLNYGSIFRRINTYEIYDEKATTSTIRSNLEALSTIPPQDTVVLYFAGHGDSIGDDWFFIPHELRDTSERNVQRQGFSSAQFKESIAQIGANRIVLLFDACKSGAAMNAFSDFENKRSMVLLSRSMGIHIATSTTGDQLASELTKLKHGVFTYALLKGMEGGADRKPKDGRVTITEVMNFIAQYVPFLNQKYATGSQTPVVSSRGDDFVVAKKR